MQKRIDIFEKSYYNKRREIRFYILKGDLYMKQFKVGVQLYSVRDEMEKDMYKTLKAIKEMGYDYVEFAGYYGKTAEEVKAMLDELDLKAISVHQSYDLFLEKGQEAVDFLKTIGAKYSAIPWMGPENHKGSENFDKAVADIKKVAKLLKDNGIAMLYHNHDFEFEKVDGKFKLDWLYETIPADLLQTEIDTCWVHYAGYDPADYLLKYTGRAPVVHLKDFVCEKLGAGPVYALIGSDGKEEKKASKEETGFKFAPCGDGIQDFTKILDAAEKAGAEYVIVEQDQTYDLPSLEAVKKSREYLKTLGQ